MPLVGPGTRNFSLTMIQLMGLGFLGQVLCVQFYGFLLKEFSLRFHINSYHICTFLFLTKHTNMNTEPTLKNSRTFGELEAPLKRNKQRTKSLSQKGWTPRYQELLCWQKTKIDHKIKEWCDPVMTA